MKKIYILVIFTISLFFFSFSSVSAIEKSNMIFNLEDSDFSYINEEFFELRTKTREFLENNDSYQYYIIGYNSSKSKLVVDIFVEEFNYKYLRIMNYSSGASLMFYINGRYKEYYLENNELKELTNSSSFQKSLGNVNNSNYQNFIDTNIDDLFLDGSANVYWNVNVNARDYSFSFGEDKDTPTLYEIYLAAKIGEPYDIHEDEKYVLLNFYNLVIEKIGFLVNMFTGNYIYLSVFVVLILIIILEIVRGLL